MLRDWPETTEVAVDAANEALDALVHAHAEKAIPAMIGALVEWAVRNGAADPMGRSLTSAARAMPGMDASWRSTAIN